MSDLAKLQFEGFSQRYSLRGVGKTGRRSNRRGWTGLDFMTCSNFVQHPLSRGKALPTAPPRGAALSNTIYNGHSLTQENGQNFGETKELTLLPQERSEASEWLARQSLCRIDYWCRARRRGWTCSELPQAFRQTMHPLSRGKALPIVGSFAPLPREPRRLCPPTEALTTSQLNQLGNFGEGKNRPEGSALSQPRSEVIFASSSMAKIAVGLGSNRSHQKSEERSDPRRAKINPIQIGAKQCP